MQEIVYILGVADGVGGWRDYGIDASKFSNTLMSKCERFVVDGGLTQAPTAAQVIAEAYEELSLDKPTNFGKDSVLFIQHMQSHPYMPTHA